MLTLEEAIKHYKKEAKEKKREAEYFREYGEAFSNLRQPYNEPVVYCFESYKEQEQLVEWLIELKEIREIAKHWNDKSSNFVAACEAFEKILDIVEIPKETENE